MKTVERDCPDVKESAGSSSTISDVASHAWDKSQCVSAIKTSSDLNQTHLDCGSTDIYNPKRGQAEMSTGNKGVQCAENDINHSIDTIMNGCYDKDKVLQQLSTASVHLNDATDSYHDGIKDLGVGTDKKDLQEMVDGRRDVMHADDYVRDAVKQLKAGDEAGALKSLLKSVGQIDSSQAAMSDALNPQDPKGHDTNTDRNGGRNHEHCHDNRDDQANDNRHFRPHHGGLYRPIMNGDGHMYAGGPGGDPYMRTSYDRSQSGDYSGSYGQGGFDQWRQQQNQNNNGDFNIFDPLGLGVNIANDLGLNGQNGSSNSSGGFNILDPIGLGTALGRGLRRGGNSDNNYGSNYGSNDSPMSGFPLPPSPSDLIKSGDQLAENIGAPKPSDIGKILDPGNILGSIFNF